MSTNSEDQVDKLLSTTTHTDILFFTQSGKVYKQRAHRIPESSRQAKGLPLVNLIDVEKEDNITNVLQIKDYNQGYLLFVTKDGKIKKTMLSEYVNINKNGKRAIKLVEGDEIVSVIPINDDDSVIAASSAGKAIKVDTKTIRPQGRVSSGVRLLKLEDGDVMVGVNKTTDKTIAFTLTANGFGKATPTSEYRIQGRGGKGIKNINTNEKNGKTVSFVTVEQDELKNKDLLILTQSGKIIRMKAEDIKICGRATQGIRMMRLKDDDQVVKCEIVDKNDQGDDLGEE
jgi:DNA gyrase subunit A